MVGSGSTGLSGALAMCAACAPAPSFHDRRQDRRSRHEDCAWRGGRGLRDAAIAGTSGLRFDPGNPAIPGARSPRARCRGARSGRHWRSNPGRRAVNLVRADAQGSPLESILAPFSMVAQSGRLSPAAPGQQWVGRCFASSVPTLVLWRLACLCWRGNQPRKLAISLSNTKG